MTKQDNNDLTGRFRCVHSRTGECWEMAGLLRARCLPSLRDFKDAACNIYIYIYILGVGIDSFF